MRNIALALCCPLLAISARAADVSTFHARNIQAEQQLTLPDLSVIIGMCTTASSANCIPGLGSAAGNAVPAGGDVGLNLLAGRTENQHEADCINPKDAPYGAVGNDAHDDSAALAAAITAVNTLRSAGSHVNLCIPAGYYQISGTPLPSFLYGGQVIGVYHQTVIKVLPAYVGDVFSWDEAWFYGTTYITFPLIAGTERGGPGIINITVTGTPGNSIQQNAAVFYDRNDAISISNFHVFGLTGRCLAMGLTKTQTLAFARESNFSGIKCWDTGAVLGTVTPTGTLVSGNTSVAVSSTAGVVAGMTVAPGSGIPDGDEVASVGTGTITLTEAPTASGSVTLSIFTGVPSIEINAAGAGDSSNQLKFYGVDLCGSAAQGIVLRNQNTTKGLGAINFYGVRVEGCGATSYGDQFQIGETGPAYPGKVTDTSFYGLVSNTSTANYAAIATYATSLAAQEYGINVYGTIQSGSGIGLNIQAGRGLQFHIPDMGTTGLNYVIGPSALVGQVLLDGSGAETGWTNSVDPTAVQFVKAASVYTLSQNTVTARSAGTVGEGNAPGLYGFISGFSNKDFGSVSAGSGISTDGRLLYAASCQGGYALVAGERGSNQTCTQVLGGVTTASTAKLTSDGLAANATDILNLTSGTGASAVSESCSGYLTARDTTTGATATWFIEFGLKRPGANSTTAITFSNVTTKGGDSALTSGVTPTLAADTTNAGITVQVAASGVADTVHYSYPATCSQTE